MFGFSPSCTPEAHKCEQKLDVLLYPSDEPRHVRIERALLELSETDPECAALLRAMHF